MALAKGNKESCSSIEYFELLHSFIEFLEVVLRKGAIHVETDALLGLHALLGLASLL